MLRVVAQEKNQALKAVEEDGRKARCDRARQLPRWRGSRDLLTVLYCMWRRRAYISSARLFARKRQFQNSLRDVGALSAEQMFETCQLLGRGDVKQALARPDVPAPVKSAMRNLSLCMANVIGSNAHRSTLRHMSTGYTLLFGPPLVFTTMNPADTKHPLMRLLYEDEPVAMWRLLERDEPDYVRKANMLKRVAEDPVSQALFSDLMMHLFLKHMLGVQPMGQRGFCDGAAFSGQPGLFGVVQAYFAPVETQGRGGLHAHMNVWVRHPMTALLLDKLRRGDVDDDMRRRLQRWRAAVLEKVGTMQFDSVEEFVRQLHPLQTDVDVAPLPMNAERRKRVFMDGSVEEEDFGAQPAPGGAFTKSEKKGERKRNVPWRDDPPQGPTRQRPLLPLQATEPTGSNPCFHLPIWRRLPPYRMDRDQGGEAKVVQIGDQASESRRYAACFAQDARANYCKSHVHRCTNTCWKHRAGGRPGDRVRLCRFNFWRTHEVAYYSRRWPKQLNWCKLKQCPLAGQKRLVLDQSGLCIESRQDIHPWHCPPDAASCVIKRWHRKGKQLVLPRSHVGDCGISSCINCARRRFVPMASVDD